jgi:methyl-accepting chemotaxis protein
MPQGGASVAVTVLAVFTYVMQLPHYYVLIQAIDSRTNGGGGVESTVHRQADEISRLKREMRDGFETIRQSIEEMKEMVEGRRQLMEQQLKKEMSQIRKMIVLV